MRITDFFQDLGRPVAYYPKLTHITGGVKETVLLCQLLYWQGKQSNREGWIYKTRDEIHEETGLSRTEQERARKELKRRGFIEEQLKGIPAKVHFKINIDAINEAWEEYITNEPTEESENIEKHEEATNKMAENPPTRWQETCQLDGGKPANWMAENLPTITENTTENTTKTTTKKECTQKIKYAENVSMTEKEYNKLLNEYGEFLVGKMIEKLDNYKGSTGKKYKDDYRTIKNWVADQILKDYGNTKKSKYSDLF